VFLEKACTPFRKIVADLSSKENLRKEKTFFSIGKKNFFAVFSFTKKNLSGLFSEIKIHKS